jgi:mitochondrial fission protein ELM1
VTLHARSGLDKIVLGVRKGVTASSKPPVRMFVATEPAQYRAERVFIWSVEQVRDPSRVYEIHLMKGLQGFNGRSWLTGFTNYRFAIPELAGGQGRALYNDVDQVYLQDPAELFDLPIGEHGFLTVPPQHNEATADTSVMLLDCERMLSLWNLKAAQAHKKNELLGMAKQVPGLRGDLLPEWNDCDEEYRPGHTRCLHFTIIHTQPWQPFPETFAYRKNPVADVWLGMEAAADAEGYQPFGSDHPSAGYARLVASSPARKERLPGQAESRELLDLLEQTRPESLLDWGLGSRDEAELSALLGDARTSLSLTRRDAASCAVALAAGTRFSGALCLEALDFIPDEDIAWVLDELFECASLFVFAVVSNETRAVTGVEGLPVRNPLRSSNWWLDKFHAASARHPKVHWRLCLRGDESQPEVALRVRSGGPPLGREPLVWILNDGKPGHTTQSLGLAQALGWPCEIKELRFNRLASLQRHLNVPLGRVGSKLLGLDSDASDPLSPPWPDVVIATGWRPAPVARWIAQQSRGHTRLVQMGRQGAWLADSFDVVLTCSHFGAPPHPRRIETLLPLHQALPEKFEQAKQRWPDLFGSEPHPHILLLVGGSTRRYRLDAEGARALAEQVQTLCEAAGGSLLAVTSRRTGAAATASLEKTLGPERVHRFSPGPDNPYLGYLAAADAIVVTGESESMLAEAVATGATVYIHPLPEPRPGVVSRVQDWVVARSQQQPLSRRGRVRPQQGAEYFFARLIERGLIRPRRDLVGLHQRLIQEKMARPLGEITAGRETGTDLESDGLARRLRARLALGGA